MRYRIIKDESDLLEGDVAVYAHPSDMKPRLCLMVLAAADSAADHACIDIDVRNEGLKLLGPSDHYGRVVLSVGDEYAYVTDPQWEAFVMAYRFIDDYGNQHTATAYEFGYAVGRSL
ncbi:hypothetical protein [Bifidobacterium choerinum]|uniref:Uncharacterized protein n=1 Tax=Bifidobacterium choerinum TaxID=35760 RepID=A0A2D3D4M2_9BIFI|nr:hypothetical protein [Bifidobacterium choerinum]ATU19806.1 hypothetical protein BcFMB_01365 [Bifidobacterium choerinum]